MYQIKDYLNEHYSDYQIYHLDDMAYLYKLVNNELVNKFDLNNEGNMGYHGDEKYIKEMQDVCLTKKCAFLIDSHYEIDSQISIKLRNYVMDNYHFDKTIKSVDIYTNT